MATWRERVVAARERGHFTAEDISDAGCYKRCAVGEVAARLGGDYSDVDLRTADDCPVGGAFPFAVLHNRFAEAEDILDLLDDHVLQLKRERTESER